MITNINPIYLHSDTKFTPEELVAMILIKAKEYAENFAHQKIKESVITVPAFFNQAERRAMLKAAELAGLKGFIICKLNNFQMPLLNYFISLL